MMQVTRCLALAPKRSVLRCRLGRLALPVLFAGAVSLFAGACKESGESFKSRAGDLSDYTYAGMRGKSYGPNARGAIVSLEDFEGVFVWVDYAGPWCGACGPQAEAMRNLERAFSEEDVVFLTVMTSANDAFKPSTQQTAMTWARRHKLNPENVVSEGLTYRKVPHHILFSPFGQTLYRKSGYLRANQIKSTLSEKIKEWDEWYARSENGA